MTGKKEPGIKPTHLVKISPGNQIKLPWDEDIFP